MSGQDGIEETRALVDGNQVVAACDESVKDSVIGSKWLLAKRGMIILDSIEIFSKDWENSASQPAEALILLDFTKTQ